MGQVLDSVSRILAQSEARAEVAAQNIANLTTPGYKRRVAFTDLLASGSTQDSMRGAALSIATDLSVGKPIQTGAALDLSLGGDGFFVLRAGDQIVYTRHGQFHRDADGRVISPQGEALQLQDGGDLVLRSDAVKIDADGAVTDGSEVVGRLAVVAIEDPARLARISTGGFTASAQSVSPMEKPQVRQGVLEASNVSAGDEMVAVMEAVRRAESGQRLANVYDDLLGRAITTFGQV